MAELRQLARQVRDLYEAARFVDAYRLTEPHWRSPSVAEGMAPEELVLAGRLSSRLGGVRVAGALFRQALETAPDHPAVRYFCRGVRAKAGLFSELEDFVSRPELETDDADLRASWLASHASAFAMVRDFERAAALIERAHHEDTNAGWVDSCHCEILSRQDRREEALLHARRAWERQPGMPSTAWADSALCRPTPPKIQESVLIQTVRYVLWHAKGDKYCKHPSICVGAASATRRVDLHICRFSRWRSFLGGWIPQSLARNDGDGGRP